MNQASSSRDQREDDRHRLAPAEEQRLQRVERLAQLLDESIRLPGIGYRIGYDAIVGLLPVVGDAAGLLIGSYVVIEAARFRIPKSTLVRMVANVALEAVLGAVPLVGDVFDAVYKANLRNVRLLHRRLQDPGKGATSDRWFFGLVLLLPLAIAGVLVAVLVLLASWLI